MKARFPGLNGENSYLKIYSMRGMVTAHRECMTGGEIAEGACVDRGLEMRTELLFQGEETIH